jgi:uncharacterized protein with ACT and thioredoxin-like domain
MKVLKIELNDGTFIYTNIINIDRFRELMKRTKGAKEVTELEMTQDEYSAIPTTNLAYEKYFKEVL